CTRTGTLFDYW
nr:immunoglobulin heavy chain junction region [Mus musculus]